MRRLSTKYSAYVNVVVLIGCFRAVAVAVCCVLLKLTAIFLDFVINLHTQYIVFRKEDATVFLPLSLPSADQFSKFFQRQTSSKLLVRQ